MTTVTSTSASTATTTTAASTTNSKFINTSKNGTTSDIDWSALVEESVNAKMSKATSLDVKISNNDLKIAAYKEATSLLTTMQNAAQALRSPSGTSFTSTDAFLSRSAYLTANGGVNASASMSAAVAPKADPGNYKLEIVQLAAAHKVSSSSVATKTADLNFTSTIEIGVAGGTASTLSITADMSLMEVAELVNKTKDASGVQASIVQVSPDDYRLVLSAVKTGAEITIQTTSGDDVFGALGITNGAGEFQTVLQEAKQAIIRVDDLEIVRSSNEISDAINGTTLYLYQTTPANSSITVEVGADVNTVKSAILSLVDAYNAYRDFAVKQQTLPTKDKPSELFGDSTMRSINVAIGEILNTSIGANSLASLGLTYDNSNKLVLDEDTLDNMLLTDLKAVQNIFDFSMTTSNTNLQMLGRGAKTPESFSLELVADANGNLTSAKVGGQEGMFTVNGTRIVGVAGTAYEGLSFVYSGTTSTTIDLSFKTGVAEKLYHLANGVTNTKSGTLATIVKGLESNNTEMSNRSDAIKAKAEVYRTTLTMRYARYHAAIAQADAMKDYLQTLLDTWNAK